MAIAVSISSATVGVAVAVGVDVAVAPGTVVAVGSGVDIGIGVAVGVAPGTVVAVWCRSPGRWVVIADGNQVFAYRVRRTAYQPHRCDSLIARRQVKSVTVRDEYVHSIFAISATVVFLRVLYLVALSSLIDDR